MKKLAMASLMLLLLLAGTTIALAQGQAQVRVVHSSPDAPAVDVWVNDAEAFSDVAYREITDYASLDAATYTVKVVPADATEPVVIEADLDLAADADYTVVAVGELAAIEPLVLVDNNSLPAAGKAHVRFVHASPDAPSVDVAVQGGPVLFSDVAFKGVGDYLPVDAGTYDLEVRLAGTETVALSVPGVALADHTVYTIFAMGLAGGDPALEAVSSVDAEAPVLLPETGGQPQTSIMPWILAAAGLTLVMSGLVLRHRRTVE
jgi:hypothetical protein